jgi:hypothetical protein
MPTRTKERYFVALPQPPGLEECALDVAELRDNEEWLADANLKREGGRRVSEWTWTDETEDPRSFEARIAELADNVGEPWDPSNPDDRITAEDVDRIGAIGPLRTRIGKCWAVRA